MAAKIEYYEDKAGEWRFRIKAENGRILASSEGYNSRQGAQKGVGAIRYIMTYAPEVILKKQ